jgi:hypothetical protein
MVTFLNVLLVTYIMAPNVFFSGYFLQQCFICRPTDFTVPEDAGVEPRTDTVATLALAIRRSNQMAIDVIHQKFPSWLTFIFLYLV